MAHQITAERCRTILGRPKVWGAVGDGDDSLLVYRKVDGDVEFAKLYADGDGVSDPTLHRVEVCPSKWGGVVVLPLSQAGLPAESVTYESLDAIVKAGWCPYGYERID